ncbi:helix-turn-helix domain-containing protein [Cohnella cellulosilytica]|uniref:Helix-turn-helix domain-containing protein n=1 Tax=Cohnella cellulosilytica TaxID=986710 RepID=A0ABW2F9A8_9BACL
MDQQKHRTDFAGETVYQLRSWTEIDCAGEAGWELECKPGERALLVVKEGGGRLRIDGDDCQLGRSGIGPIACRRLALKPDNGGRLRGFCLTLAELDVRGAVHTLVEEVPRRPGPWSGTLYERMRPLLDELAAVCRGPLPFRGGAAALRRGRLLYALLEELAAASSQREEAGSSDPIGDTIAYMERNYREDIPRERLARLAGLSPWHYSARFKQSTGLSPIAYLNGIRIRKARELLLRPHAGLKEIALETGYRDEFYFSRKFKTTVGVSPTVYVRKTPERLANLCFPYDGSMMALQLTPCVSIVDEGAPHRRDYFSRIPYPLTGQLLSERNMGQLERARPYLIICGDDQEYNRERLARIAPTLVLSWTGMGWREHLQQIGEATGREKEAERWLDAYDENAAEARLNVRRTAGNASCLAVALCEDKLIAYRSRNMGELLYRDLQMAQPFEAGSPTFIKRRIDLEQLLAWNADVLLLHVYGDSRSESWVARLERDERWQALKAVRERRVFRIDGAIWREYSAYSQQYMLQQAQRMLARI